MAVNHRFTCSDGVNSKTINCVVENYLTFKDLIETCTDYKVVDIAKSLYNAKAHTNKKKFKIILKSRDFFKTLYLPDVNVDVSVLHTRIMAQIGNFEINGQQCIGIYEIVRTFKND